MRQVLPQIAVAVAITVFGPTAAKSQNTAAPAHHGSDSTVLPTGYSVPAASQAVYHHPDGCPHACGSQGCGCQTGGCGDYSLSDPDAVFFAGADYLFIRPHFSEAIAFAEGRQTPTSVSLRARELDFDYDSNFRVFGGYRFGGGDELRFTYSRITGDTDVDGAVTQPGDFIVDPFGNIVGAVAVFDPASGLFGQILPGGDRIETRAAVELNIYDLEFVRPVRMKAPNWYMSWTAGVRIADIEQFYESSVTAGGLQLARGDFSADFVGAGPRLGLEGRRYFANGDFALFARGYGSLLVGEFDVQSGNTVNLPVPFQARQSSSFTRTIPVAEAEVGGTWQPSDALQISAGWLFQNWFDLGTSGGGFGGFFGGADDANNMSFDGLFIRAEVGF